jgi:hypothetical protein
VKNNNQLDKDNDGVGDLCDNCIYVSNPDQLDKDLDNYHKKNEDVFKSKLDNELEAYNKKETEEVDRLNDANASNKTINLPKLKLLDVWSSHPYFEKYRANKIRIMK